MKKLRFKKIVKRKWNDFVLLYLFVSLVMVFIGAIIGISSGINFNSIAFTSTPLWFWILLYFTEVETNVYYEEIKRR